MNRHSQQYRARTQQQKREVMERLLALWLEWPDLRLGQLIANFYHDIYHVEDFDLVSTLEQNYRGEVGGD